MSSFTVVGFDVVELLGYGATGEVWLAREQATGEPVALKRLRGPRDLASRDRLRREAAILAGVTHPHVVRLRTVLGAGDDLVLVLDHAAGGSLAGLLASRGRLGPGEVVTVATPLAQALAAVHARGVVHGDVTPANVLFAADGRPLLSDLGVARLAGEPAREPEMTTGYADPAVLGGLVPAPAADVYGLAAVCHVALTGRPPAEDGSRRFGQVPEAPRALVEAVEAGLDPDPATRPTAAEFAVLVFDACPAHPVRLTGQPPAAVPADPEPAVTHRVRPRIQAGPDEPPPAARKSHRLSAARRHIHGPVRWRPVAGGLVMTSGLVMAVLVGVAWAGDGGAMGALGVRHATSGVRQAAPEGQPGSANGLSAPPPGRDGAAGWAANRAGPATDPAPVRWADVLARLDDQRSAVFAGERGSVLGDVYAPGAPAAARDRARLGELSAAGLRARSLRLEVRSVTVASAGSARTVLRVVDVMPPYDLVDGSGTVVDRGRGRGEMAWVVTLVRARGAWRFYEVARA